MRTDEMLPACEMLDKVGYYSLECWGGATYDACLRFLNEDPWERLRKLRKALPNTKLQMLLRGQNLLGYHIIRMIPCAVLSARASRTAWILSVFSMRSTTCVTSKPLWTNVSRQAAMHRAVSAIR